MLTWPNLCKSWRMSRDVRNSATKTDAEKNNATRKLTANWRACACLLCAKSSFVVVDADGRIRTNVSIWTRKPKCHIRLVSSVIQAHTHARTLHQSYKINNEWERDSSANIPQCLVRNAQRENHLRLVRNFLHPKSHLRQRTQSKHASHSKCVETVTKLSSHKSIAFESIEIVKQCAVCVPVRDKCHAKSQSIARTVKYQFTFSNRINFVPKWAIEHAINNKRPAPSFHFHYFLYFVLLSPISWTVRVAVLAHVAFLVRSSSVVDNTVSLRFVVYFKAPIANQLFKLTSKHKTDLFSRRRFCDSRRFTQSNMLVSIVALNLFHLACSLRCFLFKIRYLLATAAHTKK